ncbi:MAG: hypothetical protein ACYC7E_04900 [Armatimonadota bacterium]
METCHCESTPDTLPPIPPASDLSRTTRGLHRYRDFLKSGLIVVIGLHSCLLGVLMLFVPRVMMKLLGYPPGSPLFFPAQSGIFLLILGICYLLALRERAFIRIILLSKTFACVFLFVQTVFLNAPPLIRTAGAGDALMLIALGGILYWERKDS